MERIATTLYNTVTYYYNSINPATLSGAIDVVVVEQPNGDYKSTPFHVRFGKYGVFSHSNKVVDVTLNGVEIDLKMKLADSGVAYFVEPIEGRQPVPEYMIASPLPEAGRQFNHTDKVLAESAKKLEEKKDKKNDLGRNRVESESSDNSRDGSMDRKMPKGPKQEQSLSEVQQKMREMPFSSSVFSNRKNRSLPDLTVISDLNNGYHSDGEERSRQPTPVRKFSCRPPVNNKEKLQGLRKEEMNLSKEDVIQSLRNTHRRKKSRTVTFPQQPIDIKVENDSDSELESSVSSGSPSPSLLDPHDTDHIADGALSDSEVDRHRNTPQHANDVTDWKWGQLPETRENKPKQEVKETKKTNESSWWPSLWRTKNATQQPNAEEGITLDELSKSDPAKTQLYLGRHKSSTSMSIDSGNASRGTSQPSSPTTMIDDIAALNDKTPTQETTPTISGLGFKKDRQRNASDQRSTSTNDDISPFSEDELDESSSLGGPTYVRTLRLSSQKLKSIGLFRGANECRFSITTKIQGTSWCSCNIYLYKWYEKIVISDIDGTITKSDVLGHVIPAIGGTWAHTGVAELYTRIKNNGYKMVYLSSRAIGQSHTTKQYLKNVVQDSKQLPDGPVLLSPTSVLMAFRREVIERRPEEFKIAALSDLKKLFPVKQPFFAGFGNRETDVKSYRAVDVPDARILIIDPSGMVKRSDSVGYVSNYLSMATDSVDYVFPPLARKSKYYHDKKCETLKSTWSKPLEHSAFIHWRNETGKENTVTDDELAAYEQKRKKNAEKKK